MERTPTRDYAAFPNYLRARLLQGSSYEPYTVSHLGFDDRGHEVRRGGEILAAQEVLRHGALLPLSNLLLRGKSLKFGNIIFWSNGVGVRTEYIPIRDDKETL